MISDDYIMGFVEGEGCFSIAIGKDIDRKPRKGGKKAAWKKPALGIRVKPTFRVTAAEDENAVLYAIKERFGIGSIYTQQRKGNSSRNKRPVTHYYVQSFKDLQIIEDFFKNKTFYTSKGNSFKLWQECLEIIKNKGHLTKEGLLRICELRDKMNPRLGGKNSRTADIIKNILEIKPEHIEVHAKQAQLIHNPNQLDITKWHRKRQGAFKLEEINPLPAQS